MRAFTGAREEQMSEQSAYEFLRRLAIERGAIVSSASCSTVEIAMARAQGRFFVGPDALGYVLRPKHWLDLHEALDLGAPSKTLSSNA